MFAWAAVARVYRHAVDSVQKLHDWGSRGRGFESRRSDHFFKYLAPTGNVSVYRIGPRFTRVMIFVPVFDLVG